MAEMPTGPTTPEDEALAAEYALGLLEANEREAFEQRLRDDAALRDVVANWEASLLPLADTIEPHAPPAGVFSRIEKHLFAVGAEPYKRNFLDSLSFWRGFSAVAAATALFLAIVLFGPSVGPQSDGQALIAQLQNEERVLRVTAYFEQGSETLVVTRSSGDAEPGRDFELWLIAPESDPVSLGTLPIGERAEISLTEELSNQLSLDASLAISDEPSGGSPTGQPTGDILASGPISALQI